jgi:hypothetical protein
MAGIWISEEGAEGGTGVKRKKRRMQAHVAAAKLNMRDLWQLEKRNESLLVGADNDIRAGPWA